MLSLIEAKKRGVKVVLITPDKNNSRTIKDYLEWECERHGIDILWYPNRMLHLKALLIDDELLVTGSSNFDYFSYYLLEEVIVVFKEKYIIESFKNEVLKPDLLLSGKPNKKINTLKGYGQNIKLHGFFSALKFLQHLS